jgi:hypothetical protein
VKAITIKQPWATLIAIGVKDIENRCWATNYRGPIAIHSSKRLNWDDVEDAAELMKGFIPKFSVGKFCHEVKTEPWRYPLGSIIAAGFLVDCVAKSDSPWFMGEFGFLLRNVEKLPMPIPMKGALGLWDVSDELIGLRRVWGETKC